MPDVFKAALTALALSASAAGAQPFLEFSALVSGEVSTAGAAQFCASFVVDASDPTQTPIPSSVHVGVNGSGPFESPGAQTPSVSFSVSSVGSLSLTLTVLTNGAPAFGMFILEGGPSRDPDGSLPDDPAAYSGWSFMVANASTPGGNASVAWVSSTGFTGGMASFTVREVADPTPPEPDGCSEADLAEPYGVLNFDDVLAYLSAFGAGCP